MQTLRLAASTVGGEDRLAQYLREQPERLARWLSGKEQAPLAVFLEALDIVADGPYARFRAWRLQPDVR
jgi:hypothetical protein